MFVSGEGHPWTRHHYRCDSGEWKNQRRRSDYYSRDRGTHCHTD